MRFADSTDRHCHAIAGVLAALLWMVMLRPDSVAAQAPPPPGESTSQTPDVANRVATEVKYEQRLGQTIPPGLMFTDSDGEAAPLDALLSGHPSVLVMAYYRCPMLCTLVLNATVDTLKEISLKPGADYHVVVVSIDPEETPELAANNRRAFLDRYDRPVDSRGVHFLTGQQRDIGQLADAVGFRYVYDEQSHQFGHPSGIVIVTPERTVSKYFLGIEYVPGDVRLALVEASQGQVGTLVDQVLLLCYQYDPTTGKYGLVITNVLRLGGVATVLLIGGGIGIMLWVERRRRAGAHLPGAPGGHGAAGEMLEGRTN